MKTVKPQDLYIAYIFDKLLYPKRELSPGSAPKNPTNEEAATRALPEDLP